ncbi:hypothetical protein BHG04_29175, partial [Klebsiella pneumoniae]
GGGAGKFCCWDEPISVRWIAQVRKEPAPLAASAAGGGAGKFCCWDEPISVRWIAQVRKEPAPLAAS